MTSIDRLTALREDFESGKNPLAFVPYALALRQERLYSRAIEVCQRGLTRAPESVTARTLLARLYCDIGSYAESFAILEPLSRSSPDATGVRVTLARTLLCTQDLDRADPLIQQLLQESPEDPEVKLLESAFRSLLSIRRRGILQNDTTSFEPPPTTVQEVLDQITRRVHRACPVLGALITSLNASFDPVRTGNSEPLRAASEAIREIHKACTELEVGSVVQGQIELDPAVILFACSADELVLLLVESSDRLGRAKAAFAHTIAHYLPIAHTADTVSSEVPA